QRTFEYLLKTFIRPIESIIHCIQCKCRYRSHEIRRKCVQQTFLAAIQSTAINVLDSWLTPTSINNEMITLYDLSKFGVDIQCTFSCRSNSNPAKEVTQCLVQQGMSHLVRYLAICFVS